MWHTWHTAGTPPRWFHERGHSIATAAASCCVWQWSGASEVTGDWVLTCHQNINVCNSTLLALANLFLQ